MRTITLLLLIGFLFLYSLKSKLAALYTYWWFAIFRPHEWAWEETLTDLHLPKIAALIFLGSSLYYRKIPKVNNSLTFLILLFLALEVLATLLNGCFDSTAKLTFTIFDLATLFVVVLLTIETLEKRIAVGWLVTIIALSIGFHSGKGGIYALITRADNYGAENLTGMFSGSNSYALGTGMLIFFMLFSLQFISDMKLEEIKIYRPGSTSRLIKWMARKFCILLLPFIIFGSFYTIVSLQSRGAFLATSIALVLWILLHRKAKRLILYSIVGIGIALSVVPLPENYAERIASAFADKGEQDRSVAARPHFWRIAFEIAKDHPLGIGTGCYKAYYSRYDPTRGLYGFNRSVHSSHFQVLADVGFPGILVWFTLFLVSFRKLWAIRKASKKNLAECERSRFYFNISNALICTMATFFIGGSFYEYAYNDIIWLLWGMVVVLERFHRVEAKEPQRAASEEPKPVSNAT